MPPSESLSIAIIDQNAERAQSILAGLRQAGYERLTLIEDTTDLVRRLVGLAPSVIIIDLENPKRDTVEQMFRVSREVKRPVVMFVDDSDESMIREAIRAGISAYVVDGLRPDRVRPIVETAIHRFQLYRRMEEELLQARAALDERKIIERAKGILMTSRSLTEDQAYAALRRHAMNTGKRLAEVAGSIVTASKLGL